MRYYEWDQEPKKKIPRTNIPSTDKIIDSKYCQTCHQLYGNTPYNDCVHGHKLVEVVIDERLEATVIRSRATSQPRIFEQRILN